MRKLVTSGHTVSNLTFTEGERLFVNGGTAVDTTLQDFARARVKNGGVLSGTVLGSGAVSFVGHGGVAVATEIDGGGEEIVRTGASFGTVVHAGGEQYVASGVATGTLILAGGEQSISEDDTAVSVSAIVMSGGHQYDDGFASATFVMSGGVQSVRFMGSAADTTVTSGGAMFIDMGAATGTVLQSGGVEVVLLSGSATATQVQSGGILVVLPGGVATDTQVAAGGRVVSTGVVLVSGTSVKTGLVRHYDRIPELAHEYVLAGGSAVGTHVEYDGQVFVYSGGIAIRPLITTFGLIGVESGGRVESAIARGYLDVDVGGSIADTDVAAGGKLFTARDTLAQRTVVASDGSMVIDGRADGILVHSGGYLDTYGTLTAVTLLGGYLQAGFATISGLTLHSGAIATAAAGSITDALIESAALLRLYDGGTATDLTLRAGAMLDLGDIQFAASATATLGPNDVLTVTGVGAEHEAFQLAGNYAHLAFTLADDHDLGTELTVVSAAPAPQREWLGHAGEPLAWVPAHVA